MQAGWIEAGEQPQSIREAGFPFPGEQMTLLLVTKRDAKLIKSDSRLPHHETFTLVNISDTFSCVVTALGSDPAEELRRAYPRGAAA